MVWVGDLIPLQILPSDHLFLADYMITVYLVIIIRMDYTFSCLEAAAQLELQLWEAELSILLTERKRE